MSNRRKRRDGPLQARPAQLPATPELRNAVIQIVRAEMFSGPLPHPEHLERYERLLPGLAHRIVSMAESNAAHRQHLEKTVIEGNVRVQGTALWIAAALAALIVLVGALLVYLGKTDVGLWVIFLDVLVLAGIFVGGKVAQSRERKQRREDLERSPEPRR